MTRAPVRQAPGVRGHLLEAHLGRQVDVCVLQHEQVLWVADLMRGQRAAKPALEVAGAAFRLVETDSKSLLKELHDPLEREKVLPLFGGPKRQLASRDTRSAAGRLVLNVLVRVSERQSANAPMH
jgi:hypothetical protein